MDFIVIELWELKIGDEVRRFKDVQPRTSTRAFVRDIERGAGGMMRVHLELIPPKGPPRQRKFEANDFTRIRAKRPATCLKPICENHSQERGPDHHVCAEHWMIQETAA